jgi:hypothetical protein
VFVNQTADKAKQGLVEARTLVAHPCVETVHDGVRVGPCGPWIPVPHIRR